ncbi:MAG: ParB N-terminal domain-containing protein [Bacteriovoracaceae bacterium]|nr:ParB N-terminal domain-containing protein [Bacteriovoracaceae bacterium]
MGFERASSSKGESKNKKLTERAKLKQTKEWEIKPINLKSIMDNPEQARSYYDPQKLEDLKRSIRKEGVINPPVLHRVQLDDGVCYQIKSGHRRIRAVRDLGWTEINCKVIPENHLIEATLSAVSTNHFVDNIHPVDKGVEVNSVLIKMPGSESDRIEAISAYLGVSPKTVKEWHSYFEIIPQLRELLVKNNIRTKFKLRKSIKFSRMLNERDLGNEEIGKHVSEFFEKLNDNGQDDTSLRVLPQKGSSSHYVYFDPKEDCFKMRKTWKKLSKREQRDFADFLIACAMEVDGGAIDRSTESR